MTKPAFKLTAKQNEALTLAAGPQMHTLFDGGSRSGKTLLHLRNVVLRALKAPGSRHAVLRFRFSHCKHSVVLDTFPKMMGLCFPGLYNPKSLSKTDWYYKLPNGSEIWFGGLDDKERTEKILGMEFATIYLVECSQLSWQAVGIVKTRLAQNVMCQIKNRDPYPLPLRMYYDCNPPSKGHWIYKIFYLKKDPDTKEPLPDPQNYQAIKMNPKDNEENLPPEYFVTLDGLSANQRLRFRDGEFSDATPNQLFSDVTIETWRQLQADNLPDFVRVVVGVDPSGADDVDNADNDAIGIVVGALGTDGNAYLLEDCTVKAGPAVWGKVACDAWERHRADKVVAEQNYGGAMVKSTIQTYNSRIPYKKVNATRGKHVRAEPFSALYEQGKVRHVGVFSELEDQLTSFSTYGYLGNNSPNNADAWIWVLVELFPGILKISDEQERKKVQENEQQHLTGYLDHDPSGQGWMM